MRTLRSLLMVGASLVFIIPMCTLELDKNASTLSQIIGRAIVASTGVIILYVEWWTIKNRSAISSALSDSTIE